MSQFKTNKTLDQNTTHSSDRERSYSHGTANSSERIQILMNRYLSNSKCCINAELHIAELSLNKLNLAIIGFNRLTWIVNCPLMKSSFRNFSF